ncbi:MAG TPA: cytochrome c [Vicinamibacterales bacterium]|nr:cytochrome c [Vicinamibacterales bacterium]
MKLNRKRLPPERGDGVNRPGGAAPSESERGWGPASAEKCGRSRRYLVAVAGVCLLLAACRQDMHNQPKYIPLRDSDFFTNGSSARPLPADTVARGTLEDDAAFYTGKENGADVTELPVPLTEQLLDRGEQRYNIYCSPCHDRSGSGEGMIVRRGYKQPPSYHIDRLRQAPIGHFFDVMTNGFGAMPDYRAQIQPRDRWAIAAYIRALQLSEHASESDVPAEDRAKLSQPPAAQRGEGGVRH